MSLHKEYVEERLGKHMIESEKGFVIYSFTEDSVYISDVHISKEHRRSGEASRFGDIVTEIAKCKGYKKILGSVQPSTKGSSESMQMLLAYGFKLDSSTNDFILLKKDV